MSFEIKGLDEDLPEDTLVLISEDLQRFTLTHRLANVSTYLKSIIEMDADVKEVPLCNIHSSTVDQILVWLRHHDKQPMPVIPIPLSTSNLKNIVGEWDANFIDCELEQIYRLLLAANYLGISQLLELCCAKISSLMMGKPAKKIRETFRIPEEFGPEEEAKFRHDFANYL